MTQQIDGPGVVDRLAAYRLDIRKIGPVGGTVGFEI
jgi:hypothetical protein